eukprot:3480019-Pleurochrysis_carterae.AAC.1
MPADSGGPPPATHAAANRLVVSRHTRGPGRHQRLRRQRPAHSPSINRHRAIKNSPFGAWSGVGFHL